MYEGNIDQLPLAHASTGDQPRTWACALTRIRTNNPLLHCAVPNQLSHTGEGSAYGAFFQSIFSPLFRLSNNYCFTFKFPNSFLSSLPSVVETID